MAERNILYRFICLTVLLNITDGAELVGLHSDRDAAAVESCKNIGCDKPYIMNGGERHMKHKNCYELLLNAMNKDEVEMLHVKKVAQLCKKSCSAADVVGMAKLFKGIEIWDDGILNTILNVNKTGKESVDLLSTVVPWNPKNSEFWKMFSDEKLFSQPLEIFKSYLNEILKLPPSIFEGNVETVTFYKDYATTPESNGLCAPIHVMRTHLFFEEFKKGRTMQLVYEDYSFMFTIVCNKGSMLYSWKEDMFYAVLKDLTPMLKVNWQTAKVVLTFGCNKVSAIKSATKQSPEELYRILFNYIRQSCDGYAGYMPACIHNAIDKFDIPS